MPWLVGVILIRSRYCVLYIPPCQQTSYCSFLGSFSLHLYYIPSPQCNSWHFTFLDQVILSLQDHQWWFITFQALGQFFCKLKSEVDIKWFCSYILWAWQSWKPRKIYFMNTIHLQCTVIYLIVKKRCSHFQGLTPNLYLSKMKWLD